MSDARERRNGVLAARIAGALLLLPAIIGNAIDAPKPATAPAPAPPAEAPKVDVVPTDEAAFYERLQFVTQHRNLVGLKIGEDIFQSLARGTVDAAVTALSSQAAGGNRDANIALVRVQHWCNHISSSRAVDIPAQLNKLAPVLPAARLSRVAGVLTAEKPFQERVRQSCRAASFDYQSIETRLRDAAEAGDPPSATELALFARDPAKRQSLLQQAADKNFPPAMQALATARLIAVQRGETTENVASIRTLFKQAGRTLPKAKVDLANCMALGCDGHPADAPTAAAFGIDAARDGEPTAFLSMLRMPWGGRIPRVQLFAWQYYGDRLNETGCTGDAYVVSAISFAQVIAMLEKGQGPKLIEQAKAQAEDLWRENSARAMREQGCGEKP
jgi:TPR repeat protein